MNLLIFTLTALFISWSTVIILDGEPQQKEARAAAIALTIFAAVNILVAFIL